MARRAQDLGAGVRLFMLSNTGIRQRGDFQL